MSPEARDRSFDELARGLASGEFSRRKALRLMGGTLVGAAVASVPGLAWAAPGGNSACAQFCTANFPPGPQRRQCTSQGARGGGPCYECTPGIGPGPNFVPPDCPGGDFNTETCECGAVMECARSEDLCAGAFCCPNSTCECFWTTEGGTACFTPTIVCGNPEVQVCASSSECPTGFACVVTCGCGSVCYPLCGTPSPFPFPPDSEFCPPSTTLQAQSPQPQDLRGAGLES